MSFDLSEFLEAVRGFKLTGISVTRYGEELARFEAEHSTLGNIYSGTKSFTSVASGFAVAEGLFSPEDKVVDCFAVDLPKALPKKQAVIAVKAMNTASAEDRPILRAVQQAIINRL